MGRWIDESILPSTARTMAGLATDSSMTLPPFIPWPLWCWTMVALISIHYKLINQSFPKVDTDSNSINHNRSEMSGSSSLQIYESFYFDKNGLQIHYVLITYSLQILKLNNSNKKKDWRWRVRLFNHRSRSWFGD